MTQRFLGLIERHCEKAVLAVAGGLALWLAWAFLLQSPNRVTLDGRSLTPHELHEAILREAEALERSMENAETPEVAVPSYCRRLEESHGDGIFASNKDGGGLLKSPRLRLAAAFGRKVDLALAQQAPVRVVTPMTPQRPWLFSGRCLTVRAGAGDRADSAGPETSEVGWVRIMTRFDREKQRAVLLAAGYPESVARVCLVGVDAQRQELLPDGGFTPWAAVEPARASPIGAIPRPVVDDRSGRVLNLEAFDAIYAEVKAAQVLVGRPTFGEILAGDRPPTMVGESVSDGNAGTSVDPTLAWVDDADVAAGKYYRYRLRVRLWNRFVGRTRAVLEAADAERAVVASEWSEASGPVRAAPRTHFFVLGPSVNKAAANVEVWKWHRGQWLRKPFTVAVGDVIGGVRTVRLPGRGESGRAVREQVDFDTGVTLLDMREEVECVRVAYKESGRLHWVEKSTLVVVCVDRVSGRAEERSQAGDREDPQRTRLRRP